MKEPGQPLKIGLTGGIGTGKSTVGGLFAAKGARVIDADSAARAVVEPGRPALDEIRQAFGEQVIQSDGTLDRAALRRLVFQDEGLRRRLEQITHPRIFKLLAESFRTALATSKAPVIVEIPLLFEAGDRYTGWFDRIVVVTSTRERQIERIGARCLSREEAERMIEAQWPVEQKARLADHVIDNSGSIEQTKSQVDRLWEEWARFEDRPHRT